MRVLWDTSEDYINIVLNTTVCMYFKHVLQFQWHSDLKTPNLLVDVHWNIKAWCMLCWSVCTTLFFCYELHLLRVCHGQMTQVADFGLSTFIESRSITNTLQVTNPRCLTHCLLHTHVNRTTNAPGLRCKPHV